MAKSIRSKQKRKNRAVKRERYGKKELEKLKATLKLDPLRSASKDVDMTEAFNDIATVVSRKEIVERMDDGSIKKYNQKTLQDEHGNYPVWLNSRRKKKKVYENRKMKKIVAKKQKAKKRH